MLRQFGRSLNSIGGRERFDMQDTITFVGAQGAGIILVFLVFYLAVPVQTIHLFSLLSACIISCTAVSLLWNVRRKFRHPFVSLEHDVYSEIFNATNEAIFIHDAQTGALLDVNDAMVAMYGYATKAQAIALGMDEFSSSVPPYTAADAHRLLDNARREGPQTFRWRARKKDGTLFWVEVSLRYSQNRNGSRIIAVVRDISDRLETEELLRKSEERFTQVVANTEEWIWEINPDGLYTYTNPVVENVLGYRPEEISNRKYYTDLFPPAERESLRERMSALFASRESFSGVENRLVHKDGRVIWASVSGIPITDESGSLKGYRGADTDITARKAAQDALASSEEKYRLLFMSNPLPTFVCEAETGEFLAVNDAALSLYGYSRAEFLEQRLDTVAPGGGMAALEELRMELDGRTGCTTTMEHCGKGGRRLDVCMSLHRITYGDFPAVLAVVSDETERRQIEYERKHSEQQFRAAFENAPMGMSIIKPNGTYVAVNPALCRMLGYTAEELLGGTLQKITHPDDAEPGNRWIRKMLSGDRSEPEFEKRYIHKDGHIVWGVVRAEWLRGPDGAPQLCVAHIQDVTEKKKAEEEIRQERLFSETLLQSLPGMMYLYEFDIPNPGNSRLIRFNKNHAILTGYSEEELLTMKISDWYEPEMLMKAAAAISQIKGDNLAQAQLDLKKKDGTLLPCVFTGRMIELGGKTCFLGVGIEVTELLAAQQALRTSEELYRTLISTIPDLIVRTDLAGNIVFINETAFPSLGYFQTERILGRNILEFIAEPERSVAISRMKKMPDIRLGAQEYSILGDDGALIPCEINGDVLRGKDDVPYGMVFIVRDLTETKKLQAQLLQSQKMEAVGRLAGGVAHDYNNMLGVIIGYASLLEKELSAEGQGMKHVRSILTAAERSANLTRQLLAFARQQTVQPIVLNMNKELTGLQRMLGRLIGEDIHLDVRMQPDLWNIKIDPTQFAQVVTNLTTNARDAITGVGTVTIETSNLPAGLVQHAEFGRTIQGDYVRLVFRDTGCGIEKKNLGQIFEPFYTTKPKDKGTGLGLATVFGVVKQNNGYIDVDSEPGEGTSFTILFPCCAEDVQAAAPEAAAAGVEGKEVVLVVEDEAALLELVTDTLSISGYTVISAQSPVHGLSLTEKRGQKIDLLITDVILPEMNGKSLMERVQRFCPDVKTLFISGYTADVIANRGVIDEGAHFLQKPFTPFSLLRKIREVLDAR